MKPVIRHDWEVAPKEAAPIQEALRSRVRIGGSLRRLRLIAGADVSYSKSTDRLYGAVVVLSLPDLEPVEEQSATGRARFPYVPGLLTFREAPVLLAAFAKLKHTPDLIVFDGQGIAHPRGMGLASHMGVILDAVTVGCAKSRLVGTHGDPGPEPGDRAALEYQGNIVGYVVRTKPNVRPVYVSPGHRISTEAAADAVLRTARGYRLPEPTRLAHLAVNRIRRLRESRD